MIEGIHDTPKWQKRSNARAFDLALRSLHLVDRNDPLTEMVARRIIEIGTADERDPVEISKRAVRQLGLA
jgi:hypothetical protein